MVPLNAPAIARLIAHPRPSRRTTAERLAELVHQLSDVPLIDARRAVRQRALVDQLDDPLAIVAAALVELRHHPYRRPTLAHLLS